MRPYRKLSFNKIDFCSYNWFFSVYPLQLYKDNHYKQKPLFHVVFSSHLIPTRRRNVNITLVLCSLHKKTLQGMGPTPMCLVRVDVLCMESAGITPLSQEVLEDTEFVLASLIDASFFYLYVIAIIWFKNFVLLFCFVKKKQRVLNNFFMYIF